MYGRGCSNALAMVMFLLDQGYSTINIIQTIFRVARAMNIEKRLTKLEMLREIGLVHMRMDEGFATPLLLTR